MLLIVMVFYVLEVSMKIILGNVFFIDLECGDKIFKYREVYSK